MRRLVISISILLLLVFFSQMPTLASQSEEKPTESPHQMENSESDRPQTNYVAELNKIGMAGRPESDNAAPYYQKAIELCVKEPEGLEVLTRNWPKELPGQEQALLRRWVQDNDRALEQLQLGSQKPYCWFKQTGQTVRAVVSRSLPTKQLILALYTRAMLQAEDSDIRGATNDIVTLYTFGAHVAAGPKLLVVKLVGIAVKNSAINAAFKIIDRKMLDASSMKSLEDKFKQLVTDYSEPLDIRGDKIDLQEKVETKPIYRDFKPYLKSTLEYYDTLAAKTSWQLHNEQTQSSTGDNPLIDSGSMIGAKVVEIESCNRAYEQALITTLAILRYNADSNGYPGALPQLVSAGYLNELPIDPFSNKPFVYKQTRDNFTLYSFGADFDDDGGLHSRWGLDDEGGDQVFWPLEQTQVAEDMNEDEMMYDGQGDMEGSDRYADYEGQSQPGVGTFAQSPPQIDILADSNEIKARIKTFEGLEKALEEVTKKSQSEMRQWRQKRHDNRTLLVRTVQKQFEDEIGLIRKVAVEEKAEKTTEAIDSLLTLRKERLKKVSRELLAQKREQRQTQAPTRGRSRYSGRSTRGRYSQREQPPERNITEPYAERYDTMSGTNRSERPRRPSEPVDRETENEIRLWMQATIDKKADLAKAVHEQILIEIIPIRKLADEEETKKTTAAIDGLLLYRQVRFEELVKKMEEEQRTLQQTQDTRGGRYGEQTGRYPQSGRYRGRTSTRGDTAGQQQQQGQQTRRRRR